MNSIHQKIEELQQRAHALDTKILLIEKFGSSATLPSMFEAEVEALDEDIYHALAMIDRLQILSLSKDEKVLFL